MLAEVDGKILEILLGEGEEEMYNNNNTQQKNTERNQISLGERLKN